MKAAAKAFWDAVRESCKRRVFTDRDVMDDVTAINLKRIVLLAAIAIPVNIGFMALFLSGSADAGGIDRQWRTGMIACHAALALYMLGLGMAAYRARKRVRFTATARALQYLAMTAMLASSASIAAAGQLLTVNITPFLIASLPMSAMLVIRPRHSLLLYAIAFAALYVITGFSPMDRAERIDDRVNNLALAGAALGLSLALWNNAVSGILQKRRIASQQKELEEKDRALQFLACHDPMTNLYNRRKFEELLVGEIAMVRRYGRESSLIMLDIDGFKSINDNYGHSAGDGIIRQIASVLRASVRETDSVARWGGDEFIILLPSTSAMDGRAAALKLGAAIRGTPFSCGDEQVNLTASFGVTAVSCSSEESLEQTCKDADLALYMAKGRGKDRVAVI